MKEENMKKYLGIAAAIAIVIVMAGGAFAAGSTTSAVGASGTVLGVCSASNDGVINFGAALDAVANAAGVPFASVVVTPPTINCTPGATYVVTAVGLNGGVDTGAGYQLRKGVTTDYIAYTFSYTSPITGAGFGSGTGIGGTGAGHLAITPSIAANALDAAPAGTYSDTVTLTINY